MSEGNFNRRYCLDEQGLSQVQAEEPQRNLAQLICYDDRLITVCRNDIAAHKRQI